LTDRVGSADVFGHILKRQGQVLKTEDQMVRYTHYIYGLTPAASGATGCDRQVSNLLDAAFGTT